MMKQKLPLRSLLRSLGDRQHHRTPNFPRRPSASIHRRHHRNDRLLSRSNKLHLSLRIPLPPEQYLARIRHRRRCRHSRLVGLDGWADAGVQVHDVELKGRQARGLRRNFSDPMFHESVAKL